MAFKAERLVKKKTEIGKEKIISAECMLSYTNAPPHTQILFELRNKFSKGYRSNI